MKKLFYFVFLNLMLFTYPTYATEVLKQKSPVEKLFSIIGIDKQKSAGFEAMLPIVNQQAAQLNLTQGAKEELKNIYRSWFNHDLDRKGLKIKMIDLYRETFNEKEINELIAFYQSPVGIKFIKESPRLTKIGAKLGMEEARSKLYLLNQRLQPFLDVHSR